MRYGYHLVADCLKANQGKKSHKDIEATIIHHFNTYTTISATKAKPFPDGKQADILLSGITTIAIDNPAARNWLLDVTSTMACVYDRLATSTMATSRDQRNTKAYVNLVK